MKIENPKYIDPNQTTISATINGQEVAVPVDNANRHYAEIVRQNIQIAPYEAPPAPTEWEVPRLVIVDRLIEAGKLEAARQAIASDTVMYERWYAAQTIKNTDPDAINMLNSIGADPDVILAQPS